MTKLVAYLALYSLLLVGCEVGINTTSEDRVIVCQDPLDDGRVVRYNPSDSRYQAYIGTNTHAEVWDMDRHKMVVLYVSQGWECE